MATQREWLTAQGLAKGTKGRFSAAAKEALAKARVEGMAFDDDAPAKPTPRASVTDEKVEDKPVKPPRKHDHDKSPAHISPITSAKTMVFESPVGEVSTATACAHCGYSLSYVDCGNTQVRDWRTGTLCSPA